jgi:hypothetical protein
MGKHKPFILGFLLAYGLAVFLPPSKLLGGMGKKGGS